MRDPTALLVIAYAVRRLPFVVRSAAAGLAQISVTLEEAAASLGAGAVSTFARVTLPLLTPHLLAGGVFAFALSMLEVSDSLILAQRQATFPITKAIYDLFQLLGDGRQVAAALGVWAMLFLLAAIGVRAAPARRQARQHVSPVECGHDERGGAHRPSGDGEDQGGVRVPRAPAGPEPLRGPTGTAAQRPGRILKPIARRPHRARAADDLCRGAGPGGAGDVDRRARPRPSRSRTWCCCTCWPS